MSPSNEAQVRCCVQFNVVPLPHGPVELASRANLQLAKQPDGLPVNSTYQAELFEVAPNVVERRLC